MAPAITEFRASIQVGSSLSIDVELLPARPYCVRHSASLLTLGVALQRQRGVHAIGTDRRTEFDAWPGEVSLIHGGLDTYSESSSGGEYLVLRWPDEFAWQAPRVLLAPDRRVLTLAMALRERIWSGASPDTMALDLQALCNAVPVLSIRESTVDRLRERLLPLIDSLERQSGDAWPLPRMAAMTGLSVPSLIRAFQRTTGLCPHGFLMELRLQQARRLLEASDLDLAEVALQCGFSHQSHLGHRLRSSIGLTPQTFRRRLLDHPDASQELSRA